MDDQDEREYSRAPELEDLLTLCKALNAEGALGRGPSDPSALPWTVYRNMTDKDLRSVFTYLRAIKPIKNQVPEPLPPPAG